ncbi:hypothetical protein [Macrococcus sp. DPC7161]|nr:hypothetical protein [Macrococcus sp. DPC7161]
MKLIKKIFIVLSFLISIPHLVEFSTEPIQKELLADKSIHLSED